MRRLLCVLVCARLFVGLLPVVQGADSLEQEIQLFLESNELQENQLSLSYYNTVTGEGYELNPDAMLPAGALWMLPLHMYYCEQESLGAYEVDVTRLEEEFTINGYTLAQSRYRTLLLDDEALALAMRDQIGGHSTFKQTVNEAFGHLPPDTLEDSFLTGNCFNVRFWMNCLQELTLHPEVYQDLTRNYTLIQTADALAGGTHGRSLFQIRGEEDGCITALGRVNATQPFLVACTVPSQDGGDALLAELCELLCRYTEENGELVPQMETERNSSGNLAVSNLPRNRTGEMLRWIGIALGAALLLALLIAVPVWIRRRRDDIYYD